MSDVQHKHIPLVEDGVNIIIIGTGGTGGYVANSTLRLAGGIKPGFQERLRITLVDPDTFSERNLGRQLCIPNDLGKNKAQVLAQRYGSAYNVNKASVAYVPEAVTSAKDVLSLIHPGYTNVIVDCLDKTRPRGFIHQALREATAANRFFAAYAISSGNEDWNGQVFWGSILKLRDNIIERHKPDDKVDVTTPGYLFSVPIPYVKFPRLTDVAVDEAEEALSCGERTARNIQTLAANQTAATITFNYINAIVTQFINNYTNSDDRICLTTSGVYFDSRVNSFKHEPLTSTYMEGEVV